jgi:hypothetical protein
MFLGGQVFFQCRRTIWREDLTAEIPGLRCNFTQYKNKVALHDQPLTQFRKVLNQYTSRSMTHEADILNAFAGISQFFQFATKSKMDSGMLIGFFDWSILWTSLGLLHMREGFPGWSWTGWRGPILLPLPPRGDKIFDWLTRHTWIKWQILRIDGYIDRVLLAPTVCAHFTVEPYEPNAEFSSEETEALAAPHCRYLRDARGRRCGFVQIHDQIYESKLKDDVKILVLSGAQPGDTVKLQCQPINYEDDDGENDTKLTSDGHGTVKKWPLISCSGHEGQEETGWKIDPDRWLTFTTLWSLSEGKEPSRGVENKDKSEITYSSDKFTFDFYNVMLVVVSKAMIRSPETEGGPSRVTLIYERAGIGLLHYKALRYALAPGPQRENILLC